VILPAIAVSEHCMQQYDMPTAFGFEMPIGGWRLVCTLLQPLYWLTPGTWHETLARPLQVFCLPQQPLTPACRVRNAEHGSVYLIDYVDDFNATVPPEGDPDALELQLVTEFRIRALREDGMFLGLEIRRHRASRPLLLESTPHRTCSSASTTERLLQ
jgi:hypothetical protein